MDGDVSLPTSSESPPLSIPLPRAPVRAIPGTSVRSEPARSLSARQRNLPVVEVSARPAISADIGGFRMPQIGPLIQPTVVSQATFESTTTTVGVQSSQSGQSAMMSSSVTSNQSLVQYRRPLSPRDNTPIRIHDVEIDREAILPIMSPIMRAPPPLAMLPPSIAEVREDREESNRGGDREDREEHKESNRGEDREDREEHKGSEGSDGESSEEEIRPLSPTYSVPSPSTSPRALIQREHGSRWSRPPPPFRRRTNPISIRMEQLSSSSEEEREVSGSRVTLSLDLESPVEDSVNRPEPGRRSQDSFQDPQPSPPLNRPPDRQQPVRSEPPAGPADPLPEQKEQKEEQEEEKEQGEEQKEEQEEERYKKQEMPNYSSMSPRSQGYYRADFRVKLGIIRSHLPNLQIPPFNDEEPLESVHAQYMRYLHMAQANDNATNMRYYIVAGWLAVELFITKVLGLNASGFTLQQMAAVNKYDQILVELGEKHVYGFGSDWSPEVRLVTLTLFNAVVLVVLNYVTDWLGPGVVEMIRGWLNGPSTPPPANPQPSYASDPPPQAGMPSPAPPPPEPTGGIDLSNIGNMISSIGGLQGLAGMFSQFTGGSSNAQTGSAQTSARGKASRRPLYDD